MSVVNQDPNVEITNTLLNENLPRDADLGITKLWRWKDGTAPEPAADGMIYYDAYDSEIRGPDGWPLLKKRFIPAELAYRLNYLPKGRNPYPTPSKPLAEDEEFFGGTPGTVIVRKKTAKPPVVVTDIPSALAEIKNLCIEILNKI